MAGELIPAGATESIAKGASTMAMGVMLIAGLALVGGVVWLVFYMLSHKHQVTIRMLTRRGKFIVHDKAKVIKKDSGDYWHLLRMRMDIPAPPPEAIELTKNGKYYVEGYMRDDQRDHITWVKDTETLNEQPSFKPLTTQQRSLLVGRLQDAVLRRRTNLLDTIAKLAVPIALIMIVGLAFVFWEDIAKPAKEMATIQLDMQKQNLELTKQLAIVSQQNARLLSELTGKDLETIQGQQVIPTG